MHHDQMQFVSEMQGRFDIPKLTNDISHYKMRDFFKDYTIISDDA